LNTQDAATTDAHSTDAATPGTDPIHKVIITGTGRAGTTFLVQLLTVLKLDTGFKETTERIFKRANAGMEWQLDDPESPYIVKDPALCGTLDGFMQTGRFVIDHAFIPIRAMDQAAGSRIAISTKYKRGWLYWLFKGSRYRSMAGGLWETNRPEKQAEILAQKFFELMYTIAVHEIPHTFLHFPRTVNDPDYLFAQLAPILDGVSREQFQQAFDQTARPEMVHTFDGGKKH